jgi:hypothetical protein
MQVCFISGHCSVYLWHYILFKQKNGLLGKSKLDEIIDGKGYEMA